MGTVGGLVGTSGNCWRVGTSGNCLRASRDYWELLEG